MAELGVVVQLRQVVEGEEELGALPMMALVEEVEDRQMMASAEGGEGAGVRHLLVVVEPPWYWVVVEAERCYDQGVEVAVAG